jgi:hypothetical protein
MSALAQKIYSAEFGQVTLEAPKSAQSELLASAGPVATPRHRLTFSWRMEPLERRLVQVWEPRG